MYKIFWWGRSAKLYAAGVLGWLHRSHLGLKLTANSQTLLNDGSGSGASTSAGRGGIALLLHCLDCHEVGFVRMGKECVSSP